MPATSQVTSGPRRGHPGHRTASGTIEGQRRGGRGRRTAREPSSPAPATNKRGEKSERQKWHERRESERRNLENPRNPANLEDAPCRTAVDPRSLVQRPVERGAVVAKLLPEPLLRLSLDEVGRRGVGIVLPCSRRAAGPAGDDEASALSAGHPSVAPTSPRATSAPAEASGADAGALAHWSQPGGRMSSSSGISTTAALGLPATAGACCGSTSITGCCGSAAAAAACCASAATGRFRSRRHRPRLEKLGCAARAAVAVLAAAHDALVEHRLVGRPRPSSAPWQAQEGARWAPPYEHEGKGVRP
jgi:hypothetical protein